MMKHTRIFCHECKRERLQPTKYFINSAPLTITGNKRDDLCIYCGSGSIEVIEYTPPFLGGDIPREGQPVKIPLEGINSGGDYDPTKIKETTPGIIMNNTLIMTEQ